VETLVTIYWLCFGAGLLYVLIAGALGAVSHGAHALGGQGVPDAAGSDSGASAEAFDAHGELSHGGIESADLDHDETSGHAGHGAHIDAHESPAQQAGLEYSPFSPLPIAGTLCGFGGGGLIASGLGWALPLSLLGALGGGALASVLLWLIIGKLMYSMQGSSEGHVADMLGIEATVLTPVETDASGEIAYILDGTRYTAPARLLGEGRVAQHETVRIRRMKDNIVYVERKRKLLD
jgi:membrane protein implicated in regulation of membrane protease activity